MCGEKAMKSIGPFPVEVPHAPPLQGQDAGDLFPIWLNSKEPIAMYFGVICVVSGIESIISISSQRKS